MDSVTEALERLVCGASGVSLQDVRGSDPVTVTSGSNTVTSGCNGLWPPAGPFTAVYEFTAGSPGGFTIITSQDWAEEVARVRAQEVEAARIYSEANERARLLLEEHLDTEQLLEFRARSAITVQGARYRYRINPHTTFNIHVLHFDGDVMRRLCLQTREPVPVYDQMLVQLLLIQHDEDRLLEIANSS